MNDIIKDYQERKNSKVFTKIFNEYYKGLKFYLSKFTNNSLILDGIVLESLERARTNIDKYDSTKSSFKTWLYTISNRIAIRTIEHEKQYINICFENSNTEEEQIQSNNIAKLLLERNNIESNTFNPLLSKIQNKESKKVLESECAFLNAYDDVLNEINELKSDIRDVMIDSYLNNMTFTKIMIKYNLSESQVKLKLLTGRKNIRKKYHYKKIENLKDINKVSDINIHPFLKELISKKMKYNGEIIFNPKYCSYSIVNNKNNLKSITNYINTYNINVSKIPLNYNKINNNLNYAKSLFNSSIKKLKDSGHSIKNEELDKAKKLNYCVSVKGIKTRKGQQGGSSKELFIKVDQLKKYVKQKKCVFIEKENNTNNYLKISIVETKKEIKIYLK